MNKFEQVSSNGHQMSSAEGQGWVGPMSGGSWARKWSPCLMSGGVPCTVRSNAPSNPKHPPPPTPPVNRMKDRHDGKCYLPATSLMGGNNYLLLCDVFEKKTDTSLGIANLDLSQLKRQIPILTPCMSVFYGPLISEKIDSQGKCICLMSGWVWRKCNKS